MFLILGGKYANSRFEQLLGQRMEIESEIKEPIEWHASDELKQRRIVIRKQGADLSNRDEWPAQFAWLSEKLNLFHKVFQPRVKAFQDESMDDEAIDSKE